MMKKTSAWIVGTCSFAVPALAAAHISLSGPVAEDSTQEISFGIGHGCDGLDTYSVRVEIPPSITSVRAVPSPFGKVTIEKNAAGLISAVTWQKPDADIIDADTNYYKLSLRIGVPKKTAFSQLLFKTYQKCRNTKGETKESNWVDVSETAADGGHGFPAPVLTIVPKHVNGWNKITVPVDVADLKTYFGDALIVWKGNAAYSPNPATAEQIATTADTTALTALKANDEVWVKY
ncbi:DUF1775 domain-containing protein [Pendulispora albinea]|uniref:DUF1775 domain-containing protein n=1 Tax=Pendulispora albinea TaxID=2741071 RepID=A0ABZ2M6C9_9BACT